MLKNPVVRALLIFLPGFGIAFFWYQRSYPVRLLYVELFNAGAQTLPQVMIEHGKADLQERIQVFQIHTGESRIIALNHQPGLGFNIEATLADGQKFSICAGKNDARFIRASITSDGIIPTPVP